MSAADEPKKKKKKKKKKDKQARPPKPPRPKFVAAKYEGEHDDECFMCFKGGSELCRAVPSPLPPSALTHRGIPLRRRPALLRLVKRTQRNVE